MAEFKKGDRVQVHDTAGESYARGLCGTVMQDNSFVPWVKMDESREEFDICPHLGITDKRAYCALETDLEHLEDEPVPCVEGPPTVDTEKAVKYDDGKTRYDLLWREMVEGPALVAAFGANKYGDNNWMNGLSIRRLFSALLRHVWAAYFGERHDPESNLPHLYHAMWNCGAIMWTLNHKPEYDDRKEV